MIGSLDPSITQYADALYEKKLAESRVTVWRESTKYLQERSKTQDHRQLFSGIDYQAYVRIYADHIERSTAARLDSYQKAFSEINRQPTEGELSEILDDFQATWEAQIKHSNHALHNFLAARTAPAGLDLSGDLRAKSAYGHDRVLQEWKIWRGRVLLQKSSASSEARSQNSVPVSSAVTQPDARRTEPAVDTVATQRPDKDRGMKSIWKKIFTRERLLSWEFVGWTLGVLIGAGLAMIMIFTGFNLALDATVCLTPKHFKKT